MIRSSARSSRSWREPVVGAVRCAAFSGGTSISSAPNCFSTVPSWLHAGTVGEDDKDQRVTAYRHRSGHDRVTGGARVARKDDRGAVRRSNQRSWVCVLTRSVDGRALASDDDQPSVRFGMQGGGDPAHAATRPSSSLGNGTSEEWGQRRRGDGSSRVEDDGHGVAIPPHDGSDGPRCRRIT